VIHDFGLLTTELGRHDAEIKRLVTSSNAALGNFANQQQSIQDSLREFPATLTAMKAGLASSDRFTTVARPALFGLIPQAQALTPAFKASERFFRETTAPIGEQIRPFTRQIRPVLTHINEGAEPLNKTVSGFGSSLGSFNHFLNELTYNPSGSKESFLFYLPWLNHDLNAGYVQDAGGPIRRVLAMFTCNGAYLAAGVAAIKPQIKTVLQGANIPRPKDLPPIAADKSNPAAFCGPGSQ
jgi:phospholipid/cholesterol/gamma-HCH transport system substrate-binding protein